MSSYRRWASRFHLNPESDTADILSALAFCFMIYAVFRSSVRFFGLALPGQCVNTVVGLSLDTGDCVNAIGFLGTRVATNESAHAWSWALIGAAGVFLSLYPKPQSARKKGELRSIDGGRGFAAIIFIVAVHELIWYVIYGGFYDFGSMARSYTALGYIMFLLTAIGIYGVVRFHKDLDLKIFAVGFSIWLIQMVSWGVAGYPITLDFKTGMTTLYGDPATDYIELASWLPIVAVVIMAYMAKARKKE